MKVRKYTRGCHPLFILNGIVGLESECGRLSACDSRESRRNGTGLLSPANQNGYEDGG